MDTYYPAYLWLRTLDRMRFRGLHDYQRGPRKVILAGMQAHRESAPQSPVRRVSKEPRYRISTFVMGAYHRRYGTVEC